MRVGRSRVLCLPARINHASHALKGRNDPAAVAVEWEETETVFRIPPASRKNLERALDQVRAAQPTYAAVGATATGQLPGGFRHDRHELRLGDASTFDRAKEGLSRWQVHVGAGAGVFPGDTIAGRRAIQARLHVW